MGAVRLLERGWRRDRRGWAVATVALLASAAACLVLATGLLEGMRSATESNVADVYVHGLRVTPGDKGPMPAGRLSDADVRLLEGTGATLAVRLETQGVLVRGTLAGTAAGAVVGGGQVPVEVPGSEGGGVALAVLVGIADDDPGRGRLKQHLVSGALPTGGDGEEMPVAVSLRRLRQIAVPEDTDPEDVFGSWPPPASALASLSLEVTAVQHDPDDPLLVVRRPVRIVGVFDTGVDLLDDHTVIAPIAGVRALVGEDPQGGAANVALTSGSGAQVRHLAAQEGWAVEDRHAFTGRYLGQLLDLLGALAGVVAVLMFALPAVLVANGIGRHVETHRREVAVARAIGVPSRQVGASLALVALRLAAWSALAGAALVAGGAWTMGLWLDPGRLPVPARVDVPPWAVAAAVALLAVSTLAGWAAAWTSHSRRRPVEQLGHP